MIIKTETFKDVCAKILSATDSNEISTLTETLELKTKGKILYLNVTNREYYVSIKFMLDHEEEFHATVNASLFLKLIAKVTSPDIELEMRENFVNVKADGNYKIPLIFDNDKLLELPEINIENKTVEMNIQGDILESILNYNSKELLKGTIFKPVQKMYYIDQQGCITFTSGACVNSFTLEKPIKILLNNRIVKLFKLFKDKTVRFSLGYDPLSETIIQTKVAFDTDEISLHAILSCDDTLLNSVPAEKIRARANNTYPYSVVLSREALMQTISRLLLFSAGYGSKENLKPYSTFEFKETSVNIWDANKENVESLKYMNNEHISEPYTMILDLVDFKTVLDGCTEEYITLTFGDNSAAVIVRQNIRNVLPQVISRN